MSAAAPLAGKRALVTGGSRGIGFASAVELSRLGGAVTITATSEASLVTGLTELKEEGVEADGVVADVREQGQIDALFDRVLADGPCDILVNNAGVGGGGPTADIPYSVWEELIDVNLNGVFRVTRTWLLRSGARERGWGRIINIASTGGKQGVRLAVAYSASKHGVVGLTKALSFELAPVGITVNAVCPGFVETELSVHARERYAAAYGTTPEEVLRMHNARIPLGRHVLPPEVARMVGFLAVPDAAAITGQALNVCGGLGNY
jgi:ketoreductase